ncbi:MAG: chemotaxis protein CheW [Gammaproteobacteria bacterium]|nr:chemotaxis protein CheW [Gammaproteobacteria bacterium]
MSDAQAIQDIDDDTVQQFVSFQVGVESFGLPMQQVTEIIRLPQSVNVPLTPESLVGLANLRGNVLPIVDLRHILGFKCEGFGEATRVLVTDVGSSVGLIVDSVSKVISVEETSIQNAGELKTAIEADLLSGVIQEGKQLIQLLDVSKIIDRDFAQIITTSAVNHASIATGDTLEMEQGDDDLANSQLVSFTIEEEEYAFNLMDVEEIVRIPDQIAEIPDTGSHVIGMIDLRGRLLPLLGLRALFDFPEHKLDEHSRVLVVSLRAPGGMTYSIGLVVDEVREVLIVPESERDPVPQLINNQHNDITAVCRLNKGKRLVSILNPEALFDEQTIQVITTNNTQESTNMNNISSYVDGESDQDNDTQMVIFKLADQEFGVTIDYVQEITRIPDTMSQVPKTADFIEGMVNLRGTILPVLDMRARFGMERIPSNDRQRIIVLNVNNTRTGFIMDSVVEVLRLHRDSIEDSPELSEDQKRMMGRVVNLREEKRIIQVLDVNALLNQNESEALLELAE